MILFLGKYLICVLEYHRLKNLESFITTRKKKDTVVCLAGARSLLRPEKKKILSSVCWVRGSGDYDRKKKRYSRLSGGLCCCISFWFWREISIFFVVAGNFDYDRKKKRYSRLLAGNWQFFCCGGKFSLRPEKKKIHYDR